jgi:DNA-directed RNA polymerase
MNAEQFAREQLMRDRGADRARRAHARAETAETPAGIQLAKRAVEPLANAIRAFLAPRKGAGRRHTAAKLLAGVDPELAAYITVRVALSYAAGRKTLHSAAMAVTAFLEAELVADGFETANGALYRAIIRNAEARGLSPSRQLKSIMLANRKFNLVEKPWTVKQRLHLGTKLIELLIESLGIVRVYQLTARPLLLPTVVPPKPWTHVRDGAYYSALVGKRNAALVLKAFPGQLDALQAATDAGTMAPVYKGLNGIQATPWRVNTRVLAVMQAAWENGLEGLPLPPREPLVKPEVPQAVIDAPKGSEVRREWRRHMRDWHLRDQREKAWRFEFARSLALAEEHAEFPAIYFPHRLDFRGRVYAAVPAHKPRCVVQDQPAPTEAGAKCDVW